MPRSVFDPIKNTHCEVEDADYRYMYETPLPAHRCYFCGGISHHNADCFGMPRMPWGKYRQQPLSEVPADYLGFCIQRGHGTEEQRRMFRDEIDRRYVGVQL